MVRSMSEGRPREETEETQAEADFGFRKVPRAAKHRLVRDVFDQVASRYDLMNDLMSAGIHRLWKDAMVDWLAPQPGQQFLDVAGGTGDIAFRLLARTHRQAKVIVCDINEEMVRTGRDRAVDRGILSGIDWNDPDKSVDQVFRFLDYGHASIGGLTGGIAMAIDRCSFFLALKLFEIGQLGDGQESSTRYIEMTPASLPKP